MDKRFMYRAIELAKIAEENGDVPIGAVVVKDGKIIAEGYNCREKDNNPVAHAEIEAIKKAGEVLGSWHLDDCELYVTLEPCPMCAGAIINSRIKTLVFGAYDLKAGSAAKESVINIFDLPYNHTPEIFGGICEEETKKLLQDFFAKKRK